MSVFSLKYNEGNPVTKATLNELCTDLGVKLRDEDQEAYHTLLAVYHDSLTALMQLPDYVPSVDLERFPRQDIHFPQPKDNKLNAWAWKCHVEDASNKSRNGLLAGKTIAIKDNIAVKDVPMLMGTDMVTGYVPNMDATVVTRILEAGGIIKGKSVCENMCHSATSSSAATGSVHNPYAPGYSSGGSSSGSGALVAGDEVDIALGADQGGSVRVPAGWCGLYGLKPTFGLVPYTGSGSNEPTNDHIGPMTKSVLDNALLLQAIAGNDNIDDRSFAAPWPSDIPKYYTNLLSLPDPKSLAGFKIGVIKESISMPSVEPRIREAVRSAIDHFKTLGAEVIELSIPLHSQGAAIWTAISKYGGYLAKHRTNFGRRGYAMVELNELISPLSQESWDNAYVSTKNIYLNGAYAEKNFPQLIARATNLSRKLRDDYDAALREVDILVAPNLPYVANSHVSADASPLEKISRQVGLTANTAPFNQSGHPVLACPIGMLEIQEGPLAGSDTKLPVSMQLVGRWWREQDVYRAAYAWSLTADWKTR